MDGVQPNYDSKNDHLPFSNNALIYTRAVTAPISKVRTSFVDLFLLFMFRVCHAVMSVRCSLVVNCWDRACLLALLYVMFSCVFVTFRCGILGQVWYLIVSIFDSYLLPYLVEQDIPVPYL